MDDILELAIAVQQIPAPTFDEAVRALWVEERLRALGLEDVDHDEVHNVYARLPGKGDAPALVVSAHTDTVFPANTDLTVTRDPARQRAAGPGIGDNSLGVAALLGLASAFEAHVLPCDVWFVANTGEEGLGDLRGMRVAFDHLQERLSGQGGIGASIVIEGMGLGRIVHEALGSRRYRIAVQAPGGHSWSAFGSPSAIHVVAEIAAQIAHLEVPASPRTSFNIGRISGGTSVNTIAEQAWLELDLRSVDSGALARVIGAVESLVAGYQTGAWKDKGVQVTLEVIGDRPVGEIARDHPLVQLAARALEDVGVAVEGGDSRSSTDSNIPLSRGIPSVCVGVTRGGNAHRLDEWISTREITQGMKHLQLLTVYASEWLLGA